MIETYCTLPFKYALEMKLMLTTSHLQSKRRNRIEATKHAHSENPVQFHFVQEGDRGQGL